MSTTSSSGGDSVAPAPPRVRIRLGDRRGHDDRLGQDHRTGPGATPLAAIASDRHEWLDWIRNLAICYLFVFHAARVFDASEPFYVEGEANLITTALVQSSFWFMPVLFLVSGSATRFALARRSAGAYARERVLRLLVPLIFGVLVIVPPQAYVGLVHHGGDADPVAFANGYVGDLSDLSGYFGTFTPAHLWFLAFLLVISLAVLPLTARLARRAVPDRFSHPLVVVAPFLLLAGLAALPTIGGQSIFVYAGFFVLGWAIVSNDAVVSTIARHRRWFLLIAAAGTAAMLVERHTIGWQHGLSVEGIAFTLGHHLVQWVAVLAILGYGRHHLNRPSRIMSYLNSAAFPIYIVHQTVLVLVAWVAVETLPGVAVQYAAIVLASAALSVLAFEGIKRSRALRFLFGMKHRPGNRLAG